MPASKKHGHRIVTMPDGSKIDCTGLTLGEYLVATDADVGNGNWDPETGKWHGAGEFPKETMKYYTWIFKGEWNGFKDYGYDSCYVAKPLLYEHLYTSPPFFTVLNMSGRLIRDREMRPIMTALKFNTSLTEIDMSRNRIDLAAMDLAELLKVNKSVTKLSLKNNDMHDKAVIAFAELIGCNTPLKFLDLTCNFVRQEVQYIAEAIGMNTNLETLILDNCQLEDEGCELLMAACKASPSIKFLSGSNSNCLKKEVRQKMRKWSKDL